MIGAGEPVSVTIAHRLGRDEARRRIERALDAIRAEVMRYVKSLDYRWEGYRLDFRAVVLMQTIAGRLDVCDDCVRIEFMLPRLLHLVARTVAGRIKTRGARLLEGPKR
ncbi:MAG TPA: polyhydroxyalkanoic acid system family protein [Stellaceae bacterium]|nr:polyhydroxyalkanoic acid system family protein [Stellaceae bacterium]